MGQVLAFQLILHFNLGFQDYLTLVAVLIAVVERKTYSTKMFAAVCSSFNYETG
jgi:hypothetical protein